MGATYWEGVTAYCEAAEEALHQVQIQFFREAGYDLPKLLGQRIVDMTEAVRSCEEDDPYDLLDFYRDALDQYRQMAARGVSEDPEAQIELLRRIEEISGDWVGNILDMTGVSLGTEEGRVQQLTPERIEEVFGTTSPSLLEARRGMSRLANSISRGTAICFPIYEDGRPVAWFFAGYSAD
jgi:hypothetical protein